MMDKPPKGLNHDCRPDRTNCYKDRHVCNFGYQEGWYPRGITPTDVDFMLEGGGNLMMQEWKEPGVPMKNGQSILFREWAKFNIIAGYSIYTFMQVSGFAGRMEAVKFRFYYWERPIPEWGKWIDGSTYKETCIEWFRRADNDEFRKNRETK